MSYILFHSIVYYDILSYICGVIIEYNIKS